ncbi:hypothetical protein QFC21_005879 [Naganishia friedmannii]|uniref:Uncharacterized protein n=1 Tax=Naganishia friedmannii TaxID=89922 RepID=A0ACC2V7V3_9TREE|nr:hypothetical protein QFC21_005879 [Naganishia friedmannii]
MSSGLTQPQADAVDGAYDTERGRKVDEGQVVGFVCHCGSKFSKSFTRPDLLKRHEKIHDKPAKGKGGVVVDRQQVQGNGGNEDAAEGQVKARSTSANVQLRDDGDGRLSFPGRLHATPQGHHTPMLESTLATYPYNRIVSPAAAAGSTSPHGRKEASSMRFGSTMDGRDRNESYERGSARGYYRDEREASNDGAYEQDAYHNKPGRADLSGEPSRKRARVSSSSAARRHESPVAADGRTVYAGLALPVHRGIAIGGTTLPSLSEGILMRDTMSGDHEELQGHSSGSPSYRAAAHTGGMETGTGTGKGKGKGVATAVTHRDTGFAYPGYDTGHVIPMPIAGDGNGGTSRTPYDSRETSPVHATATAGAGSGRKGNASTTTLVGGYDSTLPSAGLEALSAADIRAGLAETGRNRRRRGDDDDDGGGGDEPDVDESGGLGSLNLAARMGSLAPRRHAGMGSLGSLINAYDTTVVGVAGSAGGVSHIARDRRAQTGDVTDVDLQQNLIWDALGNSNSPIDHLNWDNGMHWIADFPRATLLDTFLPLNQTPNPTNPNNSNFNIPTARSNGSELDPNFLSSWLREVESAAGEQGGYGGRQAVGGRLIGAGPSRYHSPVLDDIRAITPPNEANDEDKWPMHWKPAGSYSVGAGAHLAEIQDEDGIGEELRKWKKYWIDEETYEKVKSSFALAKYTAGPDLSNFYMARSIHTVNHLISLYFEKFHPAFPVIHLPTFEPKEAAPLLLASLICIGANYSNLSGARGFCIDLIEVLRKTLNALFENDSMNLRSTSLIHVYLLVVLAGLWCGNKRTYEFAEAMRGTLVNSSMIHGGVDLETKWRHWITSESRKRLGTAICLIDALFPALLDHPAYLSHGDMILFVLPCDEQFWTAPTAKQWSNMLGLSPLPPSPFFASSTSALLTPVYVNAEDKPSPIRHLNAFAALVMVASLHHHIFEFRTQLSIYLSAGLNVPLYRVGMALNISYGFEGRRQWLKDALDIWRDNYYDKSSEVTANGEAGKIMYHLGHISLSVYINTLYTAVGKRGRQQALGVIPEIQGWTATSEARHACDHSIHLLKVLSTPLMTHSLYYPTCTFVAILCIWAYVKWLPADEDTVASYETLHLIADFFNLSVGTTGIPTTIKQRQELREVVVPKKILGKGTRMLAHGKAWRIGAAFALVLAKQMEQEAAE